MDTVHAFAAQRREAAEHAARVAEQRRKSILSWDYSNLRIDTVVGPMSVPAQALGLLLAIALGSGAHVIETIFVSFTYFSNATQIMFQFNQIYRSLESSLTEAAQFTELLLTPATVTDPGEPEPLRRGPSDVRFEGVGFTHAGGLPLFTGLDLDVPSGTRIGLVGRSGGGKTTLSRLLLRMTDVQEGRILIGGRDISRLRREDLRGLIAYVPQDPAMFHRTLRENIAFARPGATDTEIRQAAEAAHVTEFVDALPDGFDTLVGERGVKLSGGQRQSVALASPTGSGVISSRRRALDTIPPRSRALMKCSSASYADIAVMPTGQWGTRRAAMTDRSVRHNHSPSRNASMSSAGW